MYVKFAWNRWLAVFLCCLLIGVWSNLSAMAQESVTPAPSASDSAPAGQPSTQAGASERTYSDKAAPAGAAPSRYMNYGSLVLPLFLLLVIGPLAVRFGIRAIWKSAAPSFWSIVGINTIASVAACAVTAALIFVLGGGGPQALLLVLLLFLLIGTFVFGRMLYVPDDEPAGGLVPLGTKRGFILVLLPAFGTFLAFVLLFIVTQVVR